MGTRLNRLAKAVLTSTHNLCFEQKYEKSHTFLIENFQFLEVKFSIYLNRRVFVMLRIGFGKSKCLLFLCRPSPLLDKGKVSLNDLPFVYSNRFQKHPLSVK